MATKTKKKRISKKTTAKVKKAVKKIIKKVAKKEKPKIKVLATKRNIKKAKVVKSKVKGVMAKKVEKKPVLKIKKAKKEKVNKVSKAKNRVSPQQEVEVTSPKKVTRKIKGYGKEDLEIFKKIILEKRSEILEQLQNLKEQMMDPSTGQYVNENSPYSLHMAEQGTDAMEREKIFLWAQRENKFLGYLDDALHRIESGTYGICIECIEEQQNLCPTCPLIPKERLMAVPHSQLCLPVKALQEKNK
jgi:RNA polymerase-binding transcription factor DksA